MGLSPALTGHLPAAWGRVEALVGPSDTRALTDALRDRGLFDEVEGLMALSPFFVELVARHATWLVEMLDTDWLEHRSWSADDWDRAAAGVIGTDGDEDSFMAALRCFRGREMLRIVWRDFTPRGSLEHTLADVTGLADCVIRQAVARSTAQLQPRYGQPFGAESGALQELVVLGMGKLGGEELNLSSDIDLIFTYPESGVTRGGRSSISNQEFFIKVGQSIIRYLDAPTVDGFVFRVDMRLRPYGDSGVLVSNFDSLELYYQEQGRDWERYALMKARPVTGSAAAVADLQAMIRSFVFRRYTDFGVIESLRDMKAMIVAEIRRLGFADDIKKGEGGIREIEFICQCLQLIYGGRQPQLQLRGLVESLRALQRHNLLDEPVVEELVAAYRWLRNCEHALQGMEDRQTQTLPSESVARERLAGILGLKDWSGVVDQLTHHRDRVAQHFHALIAPQATPDTGERPRLRFADLCADTLSDLGYQAPERVWGELESFFDTPKIRLLQGDSRVRLERFLPRLCEAAAEGDNPDLALERLLPFIAAVSRRSAYLVLLEENPPALKQLIGLSIRSPWIAAQLSLRPDLLDELLDIERLTTAPDRGDIQSLVRQQLLRIPEDDLEAQMQALGRIKDSVVLRVAASELAGRLPVMKVSDYLTFLAEVIVEQAIHVARAELVERHGEPQGERCGFAVMGYGKLGGIELSYGSDLDLVFVYDDDGGETAGPRRIDNVRFYTRLAQRVVHVLSTKMASGRLYEVDLRLRPHGESGLVAVSLGGFSKYQRESAWTWEHQALVRARAVAGDADLVDALGELRAEVLGLERDVDGLRSEVISMRRRMLAEGARSVVVPEGCFDLKRDPGAIVDIEFVVQYAVLAHAHAQPQTSQWSDVVRILESLEAAGVMPREHAEVLRTAYLEYRSAVHTTTLSGTEAVGRIEDYRKHLDAVTDIREFWLPGIVAAVSEATPEG